MYAVRRAECTVLDRAYLELVYGWFSFNAWFCFSGWFKGSFGAFLGMVSDLCRAGLGFI